MATIRGVIRSIGFYSKKYRHPRSPSFDISKKYDLFPSKKSDGTGWPDYWPYTNRQGVYLICDKNEQVLYIGKASRTNTVGARLSYHFTSDSDGGCYINHDGWSSKPRYVVTVAVPRGMAFEAPALEEYLITKYQNKKGRHLPDSCR